MHFLVELAIDFFGYLFLASQDREWSILRTSITIAVILLLLILAYSFLM